MNIDALFAIICDMIQSTMSRYPHDMILYKMYIDRCLLGGS